MDYNSKVKHNDYVKDIEAPDGFIFPTKARQMGKSIQKNAVTSRKKAKAPKKKKIRLNLEQYQNSDYRDNQDE
jgi:hypothetical protein